MVFSPFQLGDRQEMIYLNTPTRSVREVVVRHRPRSHFGWVWVRQVLPVALQTRSSGR